ncbi:MAG TPA: DUF2442 domain-containing protein [Chroococcales cyanobacterium]
MDSLKEDIAQARRASAKADEVEARAKSIHYDRDSNRLVVDFTSDAAFLFSPGMVPELAKATPEELAAVSITPSGDGFRWESLDVDLSVSTLLVGVFGTSPFMAETGRMGGKSVSATKASAARANGKKGGRPRKVNG